MVELLSHFWAPIPWMIEAALVLTGLTARWADFGIILALLLLNGLVGFWEEHQAANAIEALKERLAKQARVRRDGEWQTVGAEQLVPGDLIAVERGDVIPADGRMLEGTADADESALTGESLPVEKQPGDGVYSGTIVSRGSPHVRVLATGSSTEFGRTAELTGAEGPQSHFQAAIFSIGRYLIAIAMSLVGVIVVVSLLRGDECDRNARVRAGGHDRLDPGRAAGGAVGDDGRRRRDTSPSARRSSATCPRSRRCPAWTCCAPIRPGRSPRTSSRSPTSPRSPMAWSREEILLEAALTAEHDGSDPIDRAILAVLAQPPAPAARCSSSSPLTRIASAPRQGSGPRRLRVPGREGRRAGDPRPGRRDSPEAAQRVSEIDRGLRPQGIPGARGRPRRRRASGGCAACSRSRTRRATTRGRRSNRRAALGVEVKMVTGDRVEIARQIAGEVGIGAGDPRRERDHDARRTRSSPTKVESADGFAQVVPEDKYRIVKALQASGHIVGMTGDGVNDAPALQPRRRRDRRLRRDRRRAGCGRHRAALSRAVGDRRGDPPRARGVPADEPTTRSTGSPRRSAWSCS